MTETNLRATSSAPPTRAQHWVSAQTGTETMPAAAGRQTDGMEDSAQASTDEVSGGGERLYSVMRCEERETPIETRARAFNPVRRSASLIIHGFRSQYTNDVR